MTHFASDKLKAIPLNEMQKRFPRTLKYLEKHEEVLRQRAALKRYFKADAPFYSMFNVGEYTFSPHKLVWAEQGEFGCAVVGEIGDKPFVPDHKIMMIPFDDNEEAHYVCALANSSPFRLAVAAYSINIQQDPHIFQNVRVPAYDASSITHRKLVQLSQQAHEVVNQGDLGELSKIEAEVDRQAAKVWDLSERELKDLQVSLNDQ
jgi:hypothetical protein